MKAAVVERPGVLSVRDVPTPEIGEEDVLLKVRTASICNATDNHVFLGSFEGWLDEYPQILGHEVHGTVVARGEGADGINEGDRLVAVQKGAFAEYVAVNVRSPWWARLPRAISPEESSLCEMLDGALVDTVYPSGVEDGERVLIIGQGPMGLMTLQCVKAVARTTVAVIDLFGFRLKKALELGADFAYNRSKLSELEVMQQVRDDLGDVDLAIICTGVNRLRNTHYDFAVEVLREGGRLTGLTVDVRGLPHTVSVGPLFHKNILLRRMLRDVYSHNAEERAAQRRKVFQMGIGWVEDGVVDLRSLITHVIPLSEVERGLWLCRERPDETIKVVIDLLDG